MVVEALRSKNSATSLLLALSWNLESFKLENLLHIGLDEFIFSFKDFNHDDEDFRELVEAGTIFLVRSNDNGKFVTATQGISILQLIASPMSGLVLKDLYVNK
jgi:hypothetical protein